MIRTFGLLVAAAASALLLGRCATGVEPPAPTDMVEITSDLQFTFGNDTWCVAFGTPGSEAPSCTGTGDIPVVWPQIEVELDPFAIDVHEVTNYQYEYCVAAGGCTEPRYGNALSDDQKSYYGDERFRDYPVVAISWEQAEAYCAFVDKRLPTEFEWERVAKGVGERLFPADALSDDIEDCKSLGFNTLWCRGDARMDAVTDTEVDFVTENGKRIYHLFGNAAEWTSTPYDADVQCSDDPPCPRKEDCAQGDLECANNAHSCPACEPPSSDECYYQCDAPGDTRWTIVCDPYDVAEQPLAGDTLESSAVGSQRVIRGGSVVLSANASTCQYRSGFRDFRRDPNAVEPFLGFRCAKSL